jgi:hypothetical protein
MGYECLLTGLPDIKAGDAAPMPLEVLEALLDESLREKDKEQLRLLKKHGRKGACQFVHDWLDFNRDLNNVLTAEVCRKHGLELKGHIIGEMPDDVEPEVKAVSKTENLYERERQIDAVRFAWLEERTRMVSFSLENVLAYYLMAEMLNRWSILTPEKGEVVFREMVKDMKKGINLN